MPFAFAPAGLDLADRVRGLLGIAAILAVAFTLSTNRRTIPKRAVLLGLGMQWVFAIFLIRVEFGRRTLEAVARFVDGVLQSAIQGSEFVFGPKLVSPSGPAGFVFAFRVLPTIIFVAALFAVLYHLGIMQVIVRAFAWLMARVLGSSGAESLNAAASLFLGQTEAPLTIRPYLPNLTMSELLVVMVSGMALVSGGVLGAYIESGAEPRDLLTAILVTLPATIYLSKMFLPETEIPETLGTVRAHDERPDANVLDAAARGTRDGLALALNVAAMLIAFIALIALLDRGLGLVGSWFKMPSLSLQMILGWPLAPVAWLLGVPWADCPEVGSLLGKRTVLNELIAYGDLKPLREVIAPRSYSIATVALCGFANISSIGIQIGGIGALMPEHRRSDLARLGVRALIAATLANFLSACIVGTLI
jgi:CNT family concentrative nucleoside transporter